MVWTRASVVRVTVVRVTVARVTVARVTVARTAAIAVIAVATLAAGGCSDDEPEPGPAPPVESSSGASSPSGSSGSSGSPSPGPDDGAPVAPPEMDRADEAGAEAFAKHYFALVNHAQATGQLEALEAVSGAGCAACRRGLEWIREVHRRGWTIDGGDSTPRRLTTVRTSEGGFEISFVLDTTEQRVLNSAGKVEGRSPARRTPLSATVGYEAISGWQVVRWRARS